MSSRFLMTMPKSEFQYIGVHDFKLIFLFHILLTVSFILCSFEHSLVKELGYTGYERLRRAFDRAFQEKPPTFPLVVDAGCGTGLVGEQVRALLAFFIL